MNIIDFLLGRMFRDTSSGGTSSGGSSSGGSSSGGSSSGGSSSGSSSACGAIGLLRNGAAVFTKLGIPCGELPEQTAFTTLDIPCGESDFVTTAGKTEVYTGFVYSAVPTFACLVTPCGESAFAVTAYNSVVYEIIR